MHLSGTYRWLSRYRFGAGTDLSVHEISEEQFSLRYYRLGNFHGDVLRNGTSLPGTCDTSERFSPVRSRRCGPWPFGRFVLGHESRNRTSPSADQPPKSGPSPISRVLGNWPCHEIPHSENPVYQELATTSQEPLRCEDSSRTASRNLFFVSARSLIARSRKGCRFAVAEFNCACNVSGKVIEPPLHPTAAR